MLNITKEQLETSIVKAKKLEITDTIKFDKKALKNLLGLEESRVTVFTDKLADTKDKITLLKAKIKLLPKEAVEEVAEVK